MDEIDRGRGHHVLEMGFGRPPVARTPYKRVLSIPAPPRLVVHPACSLRFVRNGLIKGSWRFEGEPGHDLARACSER